MERFLSKNIYNAIMALPSIEKAAVEIFLCDSGELYGLINIIVEYEPKGFLDRIRRTSNNVMDAKTLEMTRIELSEIFINHPEIVDNFEIKVDSF